MNENLQQAQRLWRILAARKAVWALVAVSLTTLIIVGGYLMPRKYRADSTVFIEENIIKNLVRGLAVTTDVEGDLRVLKDAILSRNIIGLALKKMDPALVKGGREVTQEDVASLQRRTEISVKGKDLFSVSLVDTNPKFAQDFINELVRTYVGENLFAKREETYGANRFFDEQIKLFKQKLDAAENAILEFRKSQRTYVSMNETTVLADLRRLTGDFDALGLEIENLEAKSEAVAKQLLSIPEMVEVSGSPQMLAREADRLKVMQDRLQTLLVTYTESYPEVISLRAEIEEERKRRAAQPPGAPKPDGVMTLNPLYVQTKQGLLDLESNINSKKSTSSRLRAMIAQKEELLRELPESQKQLNVLEQERDSARRIYQDILGRMGQAEVSKQMEIGDKTLNFRIVDPAILPTKPVSPNRVMILLAAVALGLGGTVGIAFLLGTLGSPVGEPSEISGMGIDVLGVIPLMSDPEEERKALRVNLVVAGCLLFYYGGVASLLLYEIVRGT